MSNLAVEDKEKDKEKEAEKIIEYCLKTLDNPFEVDAVISVERRRDIDIKKARIQKEYPKQLKRSGPPFKPKVFNDSIHKTIELNAVEVAIIQTPEFFRLKNIKQCGGAYHVYPGAVHTRFEHSLGVCHLAGEFVKTIREKLQRFFPCNKNNEQVDISSLDEQCVRLAGLCYNLGYGPFSNLFKSVKGKVLGCESLKEWKNKQRQCPVDRASGTLAETEKMKMEIAEKKSASTCKQSQNTSSDEAVEESKTEEELDNNPKYLEHEELSVLVFKWILIEHEDVLITFVEHGLTEEHVKMIVNMMCPSDTYKKPKQREFLFEIVANEASGLDVDTWDYFMRDCQHLGLTNEFDYGRAMKLSNIVSYKLERHIGFREKEVHNIFRMFRTRTVLCQKAYKHPVVQGVEMMITDILFEIKEKSMFSSGDPSNTRKQSLEDILKAAVLSSVKYRDLRGFLRLTDSILDIVQNEIAHDKLNDIMLRNLYKCHDEEIIKCRTDNDDDYIMKCESFSKKHSSKDSKIERAIISYGSKLGDMPEENVFFYSEEEHLPRGYKINEFKKEKPDKIVDILRMYSEVRLRVYREDSKSRTKGLMVSDVEKPGLQNKPADLYSQEYFVLDEIDVQYTGKSLDYIWEDNGFAIHCDDSSLPSDVDSCHIKISVLTSTNGFIFPSGFELISRVYKIDCPYKFEKMTTLKIQHFMMKANFCKVYFAVSSDKGLPYKFYCNKDGEFDSNYGKLEISSFSLFAVIRDKFFGPRYYTVSLYSNDLDHTRPRNTWKIYIFIVRKSSTMKQHVKRYSEDMNLTLNQSCTIEFREGTSEITFNPYFNDEYLDIYRFKNLSVKKEVIDWCGGDPPNCGLQLESRDLSKLSTIKFIMDGIQETEETFISFVSSIGRSRTEANGSSNADNLTVKDLQNILLECYGVMAKWQNFGLALNISQDEIGIIDAENDFIDNKFRKMITIWLQSGTGEKTWTVIANALGCSTVGRNDLKTIILEKY